MNIPLAPVCRDARMEVILRTGVKRPAITRIGDTNSSLLSRTQMAYYARWPAWRFRSFEAPGPDCSLKIEFKWVGGRSSLIPRKGWFSL
jgi:hypothetical protein